MTRLSPVANTPHRTFRPNPPELWTLAQEVAAERGETVTDVLNRALRGYVASHGRDVPPPSQRSSSSP